MDKLKNILSQSLKRLDLSDRITDYGIWPIWNETVGTTVARNAQPEKIRNGTLFVKVSSSTWMQQLQYMKELITEKLNQRMGKEVVKNIFFVVGNVNYEEPAPQDPPGPAEPTVPSAREPDEKGLESVHDPAIRDALRRLQEALSRGRKG